MAEYHIIEIPCDTGESCEIELDGLKKAPARSVELLSSSRISLSRKQLILIGGKSLLYHRHKRRHASFREALPA